MIISLFNRGETDVKGTINTNGDVPIATGVGVTLLKTWLDDHKDRPLVESVKALESFYSSWQNATNSAPETVTAAAEAADETDESETAEVAEAPEVDIPDTVAFTVDEDGNVLELILSSDDGISVREDGEWSAVNVDEEQPTIDDQEWVDTTEEGVAFWDGLDEDGRQALTRDDITQYAVATK